MIRKLFRTEEAETGRVEAFSDGVLAIVITLLVLDIKVPHDIKSDAALWQAIVELGPTIGAWAISFLFVLVFWVAHHTLFAQLRKVDRGLLWLNGLFLFGISFSPFPTALAGAYPGATPAVFLLSLVMFFTSASFVLMRWYATVIGNLTRPEYPRVYFVQATLRSLIAPLLYAAALGLSFPVPWGAVYLQILVPILFVFPERAPATNTAKP
jgi:uncharacterized membrane protein